MPARMKQIDLHFRAGQEFAGVDSFIGIERVFDELKQRHRRLIKHVGHEVDLLHAHTMLAG